MAVLSGLFPLRIARQSAEGSQGMLRSPRYPRLPSPASLLGQKLSRCKARIQILGKHVQGDVKSTQPQAQFEHIQTPNASLHLADVTLAHADTLTEHLLRDALSRPGLFEQGKEDLVRS